MTAILINIEDKTYPAKDSNNLPHQAISNLQLPVTNHEFICLVGPSGCGKTTLLNIIAGLDQSYQGEISMGQMEHMAQQNQTAKIGYVFQNPRLLPWHTVRENIELVSEQPLAEKLLNSLLETMQLTAVQHAYPSQLSLGMSRRVSILRAFAIDPDILLMDEPFVSLDAPTARQVRDLMLRLWQQRPHTVLFVSHNLREAISLADRLVFLSHPPMQVISEINVPIARDKRNNEEEIESFRRQLLNNHPEINELL